MRLHHAEGGALLTSLITATATLGAGFGAGARLGTAACAIGAGNDALDKVWKQYCCDLGIFIANMNLSLDIPVIIGGELGKYIGEFAKELARGILEYAPQCSPELVRLAQIKRDAAAVGVSLMISARYLRLTEDD